MKKKDTTIAFPTQSSCGMQLRDYFAGQILANPGFTQMSRLGGGGFPEDALANFAYRIADAMMEARKNERD